MRLLRLLIGAVSAVVCRITVFWFCNTTAPAVNDRSYRASTVVCYNSVGAIDVILSLEIEHLTRKWFPPNENDFIRRYLTEKSLGVLARHYGIDEDVAGRYGRALGLVRPPRTTSGARRTDLDDEGIVDAYVSGLSELAVAEVFGASRTAVRRRLIEAGVAIRNRSEAELLKWAGMDETDRAFQTRAAHDAIRGAAVPVDRKIKHALTVERKRLHTSPEETQLSRMLARRGEFPSQQRAIGPYNCDLAVHPVAVEIFGGSWHWHGQHLLRTKDRFRYILDAGWHLLVIKIEKVRFPLAEHHADYVVSFLDFARRNPSAPREYRVVRGASEILACGSVKDRQISIIPALTRGRNAKGQYKAVPR